MTKADIDRLLRDLEHKAEMRQEAYERGGGLVGLHGAQIANLTVIGTVHCQVGHFGVAPKEISGGQQAG